MKELALKRLTNLFTVKSIVTITLTIMGITNVVGNIADDHVLRAGVLRVALAGLYDDLHGGDRILFRHAE